jgi:hypothetical protein
MIDVVLRSGDKTEARKSIWEMDDTSAGIAAAEAYEEKTSIALPAESAFRHPSLRGDKINSTAAKGL